MTIGKRIKALRTKHELTQEQFGEICDASKSAVSQWESDQTQPTISNLLALRAKLPFTIDWLLTGTGGGPEDDMQTRRLYEITPQLDSRGKTSVLRVAEAEFVYAVGHIDKGRKAG